MKRNIHTLFVPDVHGREFWREPVTKTLEETNAKIVFLGDYVDPYPYEWNKKDKKFNLSQHTIDGLYDIIELKHKYPDRIILLTGNHDNGYAIGPDICTARRDKKNAKAISEIFQNNWNDFQLAYEETVNDIHFVFSHAGISTNFMNDYYEITDKNEMVDFLNNIWLTKNSEELDKLGVYDLYRGLGGVTWASPIWADIRNMNKLTKENTVGDFQIVGHTQIIDDGKPIIFPYIGNFDCRECFYIDEQGNVRNYNNTFIAISADTIKI